MNSPTGEIIHHVLDDKHLSCFIIVKVWQLVLLTHL